MSNYKPLKGEIYTNKSLKTRSKAAPSNERYLDDLTDALRYLLMGRSVRKLCGLSRAIELAKGRRKWKENK